MSEVKLHPRNADIFKNKIQVHTVSYLFHTCSRRKSIGVATSLLLIQYRHMTAAAAFTPQQQPLLTKTNEPSSKGRRRTGRESSEKIDLLLLLVSVEPVRQSTCLVQRIKRRLRCFWIEKHFPISRTADCSLRSLYNAAFSPSFLDIRSSA